MAESSASDPRLILLADPDRASTDALSKALEEKGYHVIVARDGSKALEMSILNLPDLILFDQRCPLIGARKFDQIIRSNPRTENIPVIMVGRPEVEEEFPKSFREGFIARPYSMPVFLEHVDAFFRRIEAASALKGENRAFEGELKQMALPDLIQVFGLNRRSGCLTVKGQGPEARIYLVAGEIVNAETFGARAEKAFFRVLASAEGRFSFDPDVKAAKHLIRTSTDTLLMEGMRQLDEYRRLFDEMPREQGRFHVNLESAYHLEGLHPVTEEVMSALELSPTLGELLNSTTATDFEVLRALKSLLDRDIVRFVAQKGPQTGEVRTAPRASMEPILSATEVARFKAYVKERLLARYRTVRPKVVILSPRGNLLKSFIRKLKSVDEFTLLDRPAALRLGFGGIGKLTLDPEFSLSVVIVPSDAQSRPILTTMAAGAVCGIFLSTGAAMEIADGMGLSMNTSTPLPLIPTLHVIAAGGDLEAKGWQEVSAFIETGDVRETPARFDLGKPAEVRALLQRLILACGGRKETGR